MAIITYDQIQETESTPEQVDGHTQLLALFKLFSLFGFVVIVLGYLAIRTALFPSQVNQVSLSNSFGKTEYTVPYKNTLYENFGFVQEPRVNLPLKTTSGYQDINFLLDSGAVVSALPLQAAKDTGVDLSKAKRITLQGFSGVPAFAYLDEITVTIADKDYVFPAVFTESGKTTYILGRKGFFDDFSIQFDHESRVIVISRKN